MLKASAAIAAYGLIHSALASRPSKRMAARLFGERARNCLYRPFYLAQSVATTAALAAFIRGLPDREIYEVKGPLSWLMRGGQAVGLASMVWGGLSIGPRRLTGWRGMVAFAGGEESVPPEPEAHGPSEEDGAMRVVGPFRYTRHPMNLAFLPVLWLHPRMSDTLLAFNVVATAYLVLGSIHEEIRLEAAYGEAYERYREAGVPFFVPGMGGHGEGRG